MQTHGRIMTLAVLLLTLTLISGRTTAQSSLTAAASPRQALQALIAGPGGPLPAGTRILSVQVRDGLATANFSHELQDNFHGGDTEEATAVNSILRVLGQYPAISRAQVLIAGRPVDSLGGLLIISRPLAVIRPAGFAATPRYFHRRSAMHKHSHP